MCHNKDSERNPILYFGFNSSLTTRSESPSSQKSEINIQFSKDEENNDTKPENTEIETVLQMSDISVISK